MNKLKTNNSVSTGTIIELPRLQIFANFILIMVSLCKRMKEVLSLANMYTVLVSICSIWKWTVDGKPFFNSCFFSLVSIRKGCYFVFMMVPLCPVNALRLSDALRLSNLTLTEFNIFPKDFETFNYFIVANLGVSLITVISAFFFLYSVIWKKIKFSLVIFFWYVIVGMFHIGVLFSGVHFLNTSMKLLHGLTGFLFLYFAGIIVTYVQSYKLNQKLKNEQSFDLEKLTSEVKKNMLKSEMKMTKDYFMFPVIDISNYIQDHKEAAMLDRIGKLRW